MDKTTKCLNCGNTFEGNFCPHCGQKATTKRLHITTMLTQTFKTFVGGDNNFIKTFTSLCYRPGYMVREYLIGKRSSYVSPIKMLVYMVTAYAFLTFVTHNDLSVFHDINMDALENTD